MFNRIILIGRLTKDPELRYTPNSIAVTTFTLAVERSFKNQQGEKEADFIRIVTWRGLAESCANYLKKGRMCAVEGRLQIRNFDGDDGKKVYISEVNADNVRFLESGNKSGGEGNESNPADNPPSGQEKNISDQGADPFSNDGKPIDISDDDLPF